ncbi:hypothetical protein T484DRAFT_1829466 [Baffinella frigidus]|nr:hypothetical protein T484DRAFT_1829466 [Cryptophyta sp. CCMP2293]
MTTRLCFLAALLLLAVLPASRAAFCYKDRVTLEAGLCTGTSFDVAQCAVDGSEEFAKTVVSTLKEKLSAEGHYQCEGGWEETCIALGGTKKSQLDCSYLSTGTAKRATLLLTLSSVLLSLLFATF